MSRPAGSDTTDDPFWEFSLRVYARPTVAENCLALQDEQDLDVNLLLLCLWSGFEGPGDLEPALLARCLGAVHDWQRQVVRPLRRLRKSLRHPVGSFLIGEGDAVRDSVVTAELGAEQAEQAVLTRVLAELPRRENDVDGPASAARNLRRYLQLSGVRETATVSRQLDELVQNAGPEAAEKAPGNRKR